MFIGHGLGSSPGIPSGDGITFVPIASVMVDCPNCGGRHLRALVRASYGPGRTVHEVVQSALGNRRLWGEAELMAVFPPAGL